MGLSRGKVLTVSDGPPWEGRLGCTKMRLSAGRGDPGGRQRPDGRWADSTFAIRLRPVTVTAVGPRVSRGWPGWRIGAVAARADAARPKIRESVTSTRAWS